MNAIRKLVSKFSVAAVLGLVAVIPATYGAYDMLPNGQPDILVTANGQAYTPGAFAKDGELIKDSTTLILGVDSI